MTTQNANIRYFNAHKEAFGYLNGLKEVIPQPGQTFKAFWASTFCLLEGNPQNPRKTYYDVTISNQKLVGILKGFEQELNSSSTIVFVNARLADEKADPFIYPANSAKAGQLGVNWSAKIINFLFLKVGDQVIPLKDETTTDLGVAAQRGNVPPESRQAPSVRQQGKANTEVFATPLMVKLSKSDPDFLVIKSRLSSTGYIWNGDHVAWLLSTVKLEESDGNYQAKYASLISLNYAYDTNRGLWIAPRTKPRQQPSNALGNYQSQGNGRDRYQGQRAG